MSSLGGSSSILVLGSKDILVVVLEFLLEDCSVMFDMSDERRYHVWL
jgi:hypothetical protein